MCIIYIHAYHRYIRMCTKRHAADLQVSCTLDDLQRVQRTTFAENAFDFLELKGQHAGDAHGRIALQCSVNCFRFGIHRKVSRWLLSILKTFEFKIQHSRSFSLLCRICALSIVFESKEYYAHVLDAGTSCGAAPHAETHDVCQHLGLC
jgi:hypothetical protein